MAVAVIVVFAMCSILATAEEFRNLNAIPYGKNSSADTYAMYSTDVYEDGRLDVPTLVRKYDYSLEEHTVTTTDGYILQLHRIPRRRHEDVHLTNKPVIFLMPDIFCSSAVWVLMGPGNGLGYILADKGFDVWMGNARGTTYSREHTYSKTAYGGYWRFSWDEIGDRDLPTMIDYVLNRTGEPHLHYVGHGQGATVFFVMTSLHPEYNEKIISMHGLAPMAYMEKISNQLLKQIVPFSDKKRNFISNLGMDNFIPNNVILNRPGRKLCRGSKMFRPICSSLLFLFGGWDESGLNKTMLPTIYGHIPTSASTRQLIHYAQLIKSKTFCRFDYDYATTNEMFYGTSVPPEYDLRKISAPVFLYYSENDLLADENNVKKLGSHLGNLKGMFKVHASNHYDYLFGIHARRLIYDLIISVIEKKNRSGKKHEILDNREYDTQW